jgi:surfeit locus 1 family protein
MLLVKKITPLSFIIVSITFVILCSLGSWQLYRLEWKKELIREADSKLDLDAIDLPKDTSLFSSLVYRKIKVKGAFLHDKEIHLYAGSRAYKSQPGYLILTPLKTEDNRIILVNRGWVAEKKKIAATRPETIEDKTYEIEGYLLRGEKSTWSTLNNDPLKNLWLWVDMKSISKSTNIDLGDYYIMAKKIHNDETPLGRIIKTRDIRNDHLAYALTWFGCALSMIVIYLQCLKSKK